MTSVQATSKPTGLAWKGTRPDGARRVAARQCSTSLAYRLLVLLLNRLDARPTKGLDEIRLRRVAPPPLYLTRSPSVALSFGESFRVRPQLTSPRRVSITKRVNAEIDLANECRPSPQCAPVFENQSGGVLPDQQCIARGSPSNADGAFEIPFAARRLSESRAS